MHLDRYEVSGKCKTEYARENNIPEATFRTWVKEATYENYGMVGPFAVHRKNWLFADTVDGAKANAIYYSFIESAKMNGLNIYKYMNYLLNELPQLQGEQLENDIEKYLPWSKELPDDILNYEGEYKELNFEE